MPSLSIGGSLGLSGEITEFLIEGDNPGGTITPFGTLTIAVDHGVIGEEIAGTITPTGRLTIQTELACFDTTFDCVEVPQTNYDCVAVCEDRVAPQDEERTFSGTIIPVGTLVTLPPGPPDCPDCPECPEPCAPPCPEQTTGGHLVPTGVHDGDVFTGSLDVIGAMPSPSTTAWKATVTAAGWFGNTWKPASDFGSGAGGGGGLLNGTGHLRSQFQGSFAGVGHSVTIYRQFGGYTAGQKVEVSFTYYHTDVFAVFTKGARTQVLTADGSGNIVTYFTWTEAYTGLLLSEAYWIEDVLITDRELPCP